MYGFGPARGGEGVDFAVLGLKVSFGLETQGLKSG